MRFSQWLTERPEKTIAVVSHCDFLHAFFVNFGQGLDSVVRPLLPLPPPKRPRPLTAAHCMHNI